MQLTGLSSYSWQALRSHIWWNFVSCQQAGRQQC